jgi:hypothetical protein
MATLHASVGIVVVEELRDMEYFNWAQDWTEFARAIGIATLGGTVVGAFAFAGAKFAQALLTTKTTAR